MKVNALYRQEISFSPFFWLFSKYCNFAIAGEIRSGMEKMRRAFEIYPYCTLALNHLANHYFFTGQHFVVEQLSETALSSSSHGLLKSQSYYNLARSYHSKVMYPIRIPIELVGYYFTCSLCWHFGFPCWESSLQPWTCDVFLTIYLNSGWFWDCWTVLYGICQRSQ